MRVYLYVRAEETLGRLGTSREAIGEVVVQVTPARAAKALVIAVALVPGTSWSGQYERWQTPERWLRLRGRWPRPADLPASFQLVRMALGEDTTYPYTAPDAYGWTWHYTAFRDHLAAVLAHEIYPVEGPPLPVLNVRNDEQAANTFALEHVLGLGFDVAGAPDGR